MKKLVIITYRVIFLLILTIGLIYTYSLNVFFTTPVKAQIPQFINYQGKLKDGSGVPLSGTYDFRMRIYDDLTAGNLLYAEEQSGITVKSGGIFDVQVGTGAVLNPPNNSFSTLDFAAPYYLSVEVGQSGVWDGEMSPRIALATYMYAFNASRLDGHSAGTGADDVLLLDGGGDINFSGDIITPGNIESGAITISGSEYTPFLVVDDITNAVSMGIYVGHGMPNGWVVATPGSLFMDETGELFLKESGTGNTGWMNLATTEDILTFSLWEDGTFGTYEDDAPVLITSSGDIDETIVNAGFSLANGNLFVEGDAGVAGDIYTNGSFIAGSTLTMSDGSITQSASGTGDLTISTTGGTGGNLIVETAGNFFQLTDYSSSNYSMVADDVDLNTAGAGFIMDPYANEAYLNSIGMGMVGFFNMTSAATAGTSTQGAMLHSANSDPNTMTRFAQSVVYETNQNGDVEARLYASIDPGGGVDDALVTVESSHEDNGGDSVVRIESHKRGAGNAGSSYIEIEAASDDSAQLTWIEFHDNNDRLNFTQYGSAIGDDLLNSFGEVYESTGVIGSTIGAGETSNSLVHALNSVGTYVANIGNTSSLRNIVQVRSGAMEVPGKLYSTIANAITYVNSQTPSATNRWKIRIEDDSNAENFTVPLYTTIEGYGFFTNTTLTGNIILSGMSILENLTHENGTIDSNGSMPNMFKHVMFTGSAVNANINTVWFFTVADKTAGGSVVNINHSGCEIVQGSPTFQGGINVNNGGSVTLMNTVVRSVTVANGGNFEANASKLEGDLTINAGGQAVTYATAISGTVNDAGTWNNYANMYDNSTSGLTAENTQDAIDELEGLVTGASGDYFTQDGNSFGSLATLGTNDMFGLAFETGGVEAMRIDDNGHVGIGVVVPDYELDVAGDIGIDNYIYNNDDGDTYFQFMGADHIRLRVGGERMLTLHEDGSQDYVQVGDGGDVDFYVKSSGDYNSIFVQGSNGMVGIGTSTPSTVLHIDSNGANTTAILTLENTVGDVQFFRTDATPEGSVTGSVGDIAVDGTNGTLYVKESGSGNNTGWDLVATGAGVTAGNGLTLNGTVMALGGDLIENTYINHQGFSFIVREFAGETETEFNGDNFKIINSTNGREVRYGIGSADTAGLSFEGTNHHNLYYRDESIFVSSNTINFEGLEYALDYSANFADRSLVDKAYVDSVVSGGRLWSRSGTNLSPATAGDDILLNVGETLSVSDITQGSIAFFGASGLMSQDNANLFWDDTSNRLGIGTTSPSTALHILGEITLEDSHGKTGTIKELSYGVGNGWIDIKAGGTNDYVFTVSDEYNRIFTVGTSNNVSSFRDHLSVGESFRLTDSDSSNYVAFQSPGTVSSNVTWTLPDVDGMFGDVLRTNGIGTLSWTGNGGSALWTKIGNDLSPTSSGDNVVLNDGEDLRVSSLIEGAVLFAGPSGLVSEDNMHLFWDNANDRLGIGTNVPLAGIDIVVSSGGAATIGDVNNVATGDYAIAMGENTSATGRAAVAMGRNTDASGSYATAMGFDTDASGWYSTAMGHGTTASNQYAIAMGLSTTASGLYSTAMGYTTVASGNYGVAMGSNTVASGTRTTAIGSAITAGGNANIVAIGLDNTVRTCNQSNSMCIMGGNVGIGTASPTALLDLAPATADRSQFRLESSSGINPTAPNSGDLWWNGTELYFYDGSSNTDLLAGGAGATTFLALTDTPSAYTDGSILFTSGSVVTEDNSNLFWDDTNKRLGIGDTSPVANLVVGSDTSAVHANGAGDVYIQNDLEVGNSVFSTDGLFHRNDTDTYVGFKDDEIDYYAGGLNFLMFQESGAGRAIFNEEGHDIDLRVESDNNASMLFVDASTDRVGIGTKGPIHAFHVSGDHDGGRILIHDTDGGVGDEAGLLFAVSGNLSTSPAKGGIFFNREATYGRGDLIFAVDNTTDSSEVTKADIKMSIQSGGEVIVGVASPTHVSGQGSLFVDQYIEIGKGLYIYDDIYHSGDTDTLIGWGTDSVRINAGGVRMIDFIEGISDSVVINDGSADVDFRVESDGNANMLFVNAGNNRVGIGTNTPTSIFEIEATIPIFTIDSGDSYDAEINFSENGSVQWNIFNDGDNGDRLAITDNDNNQGVYLAQDATSWTANSDVRLKENVVTIDNALESVLNMRGVRYNFIGTNNTEIGVIAQEVNGYFPEIVDTNGEYMGVSYSRIGPVLIEAIKEQHIEVEELGDMKADNELVEALGMEIDEVTGEVALLDTGLTGVNGQIVELENRMADVESAIEELEGSVIIGDSIEVAEVLGVVKIVGEDGTELEIKDGSLYVDGEEFGQAAILPDDPSFESMTVVSRITAGKIVIGGNASVGGSLVVTGDITAMAGLKVLGHMTVGTDTAGEIIIPAGVSEVEVIFDQPYAGVPVVNVTAEDFFGGYAVSERSVNGFKIKLSEVAAVDVNFQWFVVEVE